MVFFFSHLESNEIEKFANRAISIYIKGHLVQIKVCNQQFTIGTKSSKVAKYFPKI